MCDSVCVAVLLYQSSATGAWLQSATQGREHQFKLRLVYAQGTRCPIKTEITESPTHETPASSEGRPYHK